MPAGARNKYLAIMRMNRSRKAGSNEEILVPQEIGHVWASVNQLSSREEAIARQAALTLTHKIVTNYPRDAEGRCLITSDCQLTLAVPGASKPRVFNILGIDNVGERNRELVIQAIEVRNG